MADTDADLASMADARALARAARQAQPRLAELSQERIDAIVDAMAAAAVAQAEPLARLAVADTGFGVVADKTRKNLFAAERVHAFIRPMKTVGVVNRLEDRKVVEIAEPFGVVAALVPSTNPTSTAIYKLLIALKARCPIVISPHPSAARAITRTVELMRTAALAAGAPEGSIGCMSAIALEGTQELMKHRDVAVILATGGLGLVRAAYSAGKPAYGVGPGNAPCYVERSADLRKAASDILTGKVFDHGLLCSSPNAVVVDSAVADELRRQMEAAGGHFLKTADIDALSATLVMPQRAPNPALVGRSATVIAEAAGLDVPPGTRAIVAPLAGVGRAYPLSIEKLCPVLAWYEVADWREGCERCIEILRYGGMGHTMSIHSQNEDIILQFGLQKPAFRICVNTPTTHGSIGLTTGLDPAMTLGCGGWGGNITSDNISPRHLLNIKRLAYELRPANPAPRPETAAASPALPRSPRRPAPPGIPAQALTERIDAFLAARGIRPETSRPAARPADTRPPAVAPVAEAPPRAPAEPVAPPATTQPVPATAATGAPADFLCEDDVRAAIRAGRQLLVGDRTIITPSARDLGEAHRVFIRAGFP
jgi:acetaldehyde dehydrogenase (acetylating)